MDNENVKISASRRMRRSVKNFGRNIKTKGMQNMIILIALVVLIFVFYLLNPNFLNRYNIVSMAQSLAPYAILALGVTFVIATGGIDLSIGTVCIASSVVAGHLFTKQIIPLWATIPVMILIGALFGLINGFLVAKLKIPAFIATLGTMMLSRGLSAIIVAVPNIFYPTGSWFNEVFSNYKSFPVGLIWVVGFMFICMYLMYKNKVGRYILSIGSNEEATRLSGINTDKYKMLAYIIGGIGAGIAAIFWSASFTTVAAATGNGYELDAIAGVYIGGTSAAGGVASVSGSVIGSIMLVVIRSGLNFVLAKFHVNVNATYVTYVLTGIIVVIAVLMDIIKNKRAAKVKVLTPAQKLKRNYIENKDHLEYRLDEVLSNKALPESERTAQSAEIRKQIETAKVEYKLELDKIKQQKA